MPCVFLRSRAVEAPARRENSLDRLLAAARAPGTDAARRTAYSKLQATLVSNPPMLPLFFQDDLVVVDSRVQGPAIRSLGDLSDRYWDVLTWRLADGR